MRATLQERIHGAAKPVGWDLNKVRRVFRVRRGKKNFGMIENNLLSLSYGRIVRKDINSSEGLLPESFEGYQIVEAGNIVMRLTDLQNDKRSLRQGLVAERGIVTSAYDALEVTGENDPRFWFYTLLSFDLAKHYYSLGGGVRQSIKFADFPNDWIYAPDLSTQRKIADFLDRETARTDLLIVKKRELTASLERRLVAQRIALVSGARHLERKPSKIQWCPTIPLHWEERAVWMAFELGRGRVISHEDIADNRGDYPIFSSQTLNDGVMGYIDTFDFDGNYLTWTTDGAKAGTVFKRSGKFNCTNVCGTLRPLDKKLDLTFARDALDTATDYFVRHDINPKLMNGVMSKIRFPYPPREEQIEIGAEIEKSEEQAKPIIQANNRSIGALREYRSSLITAAVTGQIDLTTLINSVKVESRLHAIEANSES